MKLPRLLILAVALCGAPLFAHVSVAPAQSTPDTSETYTFRVPSEGGRTTTSVVLLVPSGASITSIAVPKEGGNLSYVRKADGQPDQLTWTIEIKPGATVQLSLTASNPPGGEAMTWKIEQKYADGTSSTWTPSTRLAAGSPAAK